MRRSSRIAAALAVALSIAPGEPVRADEQRRAHDLFTAGAQAFARGDFTTAIEAFDEAYRLDPRPGLLFSLAQTHRRQYHVSQRPEHLTKSIEGYRAYLDAVREGGRRAEAAQALVELEPLAARISPEAQPRAPEERPETPTRVMISSSAEDATVTIDAGVPRLSPLLFPVSRGKHTIRVSAPGYVAAQREIVAEEGTTLAVDVPLVDLPGVIAVTGDRGADVLVDQRLVGRLPLSRPISVAPGRHVVAIVASGHEPSVREVVVGRGERTAVSAHLKNTAQRRVAFVLFGATGLSWAGAGALALVALHFDGEASDILERAKKGNIAPGDLETYRSARSSRDDASRAALVVGGIGLALGCAGVGTYAFDAPAVPWTAPAPPEREPSPRRKSLPEPLELTLRPALSPTWAGASLSFKY